MSKSLNAYTKILISHGNRADQNFLIADFVAEYRAFYTLLIDRYPSMKTSGERFGLSLPSPYYIRVETLDEVVRKVSDAWRIHFTGGKFGSYGAIETQFRAVQKHYENISYWNLNTEKEPTCVEYLEEVPSSNIMHYYKDTFFAGAALVGAISMLG